MSAFNVRELRKIASFMALGSARVQRVRRPNRIRRWPSLAVESLDRRLLLTDASAIPLFVYGRLVQGQGIAMNSEDRHTLATPVVASSLTLNDHETKVSESFTLFTTGYNLDPVKPPELPERYRSEGILIENVVSGGYPLGDTRGRDYALGRPIRMDVKTETWRGAVFRAGLGDHGAYLDNLGQFATWPIGEWVYSNVDAAPAKTTVLRRDPMLIETYLDASQSGAYDPQEYTSTFVNPIGYRFINASDQDTPWGPNTGAVYGFFFDPVTGGPRTGASLADFADWKVPPRFQSFALLTPIGKDVDYAIYDETFTEDLVSLIPVADVFRTVRTWSPPSIDATTTGIREVFSANRNGRPLYANTHPVLLQQKTNAAVEVTFSSRPDPARVVAGTSGNFQVSGDETPYARMAWTDRDGFSQIIFTNHLTLEDTNLLVGRRDNLDASTARAVVSSIWMAAGADGQAVIDGRGTARLAYDANSLYPNDPGDIWFRGRGAGSAHDGTLVIGPDVTIRGGEINSIVPDTGVNDTQLVVDGALEAVTIRGIGRITVNGRARIDMDRTSLPLTNDGYRKFAVTVNTGGNLQTSGIMQDLTGRSMADLHGVIQLAEGATVGREGEQYCSTLGELSGAGAVLADLTALTSHLRPGGKDATGTLSFMGRLEVDNTSTMTFDVLGSRAGAYDQIVCEGGVVLGSESDYVTDQPRTGALPLWVNAERLDPSAFKVGDTVTLIDNRSDTPIVNAQGRPPMKVYTCTSQSASGICLSGQWDQANEEIVQSYVYDEKGTTLLARYEWLLSATGGDGNDLTLTLRAKSGGGPPGASTGIAISSLVIAENSPAGTVVGVLTTNTSAAAGAFSYDLVAGDGSADNPLFRIVGNTLVSTKAFNFESQSRFDVRIRSTGSGGLSAEQAFVITVTDVADEPLVVESITPPIAGSYKAGETVRFTVHLSEIASVKGKPQFELRFGKATRLANYATGSGTTSLSFDYQVRPSDYAEQVSVGAKLAVSGSQAVTAGNEKLPAALPRTLIGMVLGGVRVDAVAPKASGRIQVPAKGSYAAGQTLSFVVTYSESVFVGGSGVPTIAISGMAGGSRQAVYASGSGSTKLTFQYVVQSGDALSGKKPLSLGKTIVLNGGTITDRDAKNAASLTISAASMSGITITGLARKSAGPRR